MARIRYEEEYIKKKEEILKYAIELIELEGYGNFSINKVIKNAKLTKGRFFHYFKSKDELISSILELILEPMIDEFDKISNDNSINSKEKIIKLFYTGYEMKNFGSNLTKQLIYLINKPENKMIFQMIIENVLKKCLPIFENVFNQGIKNKEFSIEYPHGSAFIFLQTLLGINKEIGAILYKESILEEDILNLKSKIMAFEMYSRNLFNFSDDVKLYRDEMLNIF